MRRIHIHTVDAIANSILELEILTYLQALIAYDESAQCIAEKELQKGRESASGFLWDMQLNTLTKLKSIIYSDEFIN